MYAGCGTYGGQAGLGGSYGVGVLGTYGGHAGLGAWWQAVPVVVDAYSRLTGGDSGGGHCWTRYGNRPFSEPCPNTPNYDAVARMVERAPQADIDKLIGYLLGGNSGSGPKSRSELARPECIPFWVKAIMGGKGCVASKYPEAPGYLLNLVQTYGAPETPEQERPGSAIPEGVQRAGSGALGAAIALGALFLLPRFLG